MRRTSVLSGAEVFDSTRRGEWEELVGRSSSATPFQTYEWQSTWASHFLGGRKPRAIAIHEGQDLVAFYPLIRTRGPWRTLRPMGVGPSDYLHPLVADEHEHSARGMIWDALLDMKDADLIDLHQIRSDKPLSLSHSHRGTPIDQATCLVLDLPDTYDGFLGMLGKSLRYDVRKLDKSLFTTGKATVSMANPDDVDQAMEILFDQHKRRWRKRWQPGAFTTRAQKFHREWAAAAVRRGWLRVGVLRLDGNAIGAIYGMSLGNTTYFYQAGFDPEFSSVSPGTLLVAHTVREAIEEGKQRFDFMRGDEGYKRRWKPQHAYTNQRLILPTRGAMGRLGAKWNDRASQIEGKVRARLEGRGLL